MKITLELVEEHSFHSLNKCEDKWYDKADAKINIQSIIRSCVKYFLHRFRLTVLPRKFDIVWRFAF